MKRFLTLCGLALLLLPVAAQAQITIAAPASLPRFKDVTQLDAPTAQEYGRMSPAARLEVLITSPNDTNIPSTLTAPEGTPKLLECITGAQGIDLDGDGQGDIPTASTWSEWQTRAQEIDLNHCLGYDLEDFSGLRFFNYDDPTPGADSFATETAALTRTGGPTACGPVPGVLLAVRLDDPALRFATAFHPGTRLQGFNQFNADDISIHSSLSPSPCEFLPVVVNQWPVQDPPVEQNLGPNAVLLFVPSILRKEYTGVGGLSPIPPSTFEIGNRFAGDWVQPRVDPDDPETALFLDPVYALPLCIDIRAAGLQEAEEIDVMFDFLSPRISDPTSRVPVARIEPGPIGTEEQRGSRVEVHPSLLRHRITEAGFGGDAVIAHTGAVFVQEERAEYFVEVPAPPDFGSSQMAYPTAIVPGVRLRLLGPEGTSPIGQAIGKLNNLKVGTKTSSDQAFKFHNLTWHTATGGAIIRINARPAGLTGEFTITDLALSIEAEDLVQAEGVEFGLTSWTYNEGCRALDIRDWEAPLILINPQTEQTPAVPEPSPVGSAPEPTAP